MSKWSNEYKSTEVLENPWNEQALCKQPWPEFPFKPKTAKRVAQKIQLLKKKP